MFFLSQNKNLKTKTFQKKISQKKISKKNFKKKTSQKKMLQKCDVYIHSERRRSRTGANQFCIIFHVYHQYRLKIDFCIMLILYSPAHAMSQLPATNFGSRHSHFRQYISILTPQKVSGVKFDSESEKKLNRSDDRSTLQQTTIKT